MANPQIENGHIDIANEIAEALAKIQLSGYESRVLWVLWRKTYGWHKKTERISISQFSEATKIPRRHIHRTLHRLIDRNIVTKNGNSFITKWAFQKDYSKWKLVTKNGDTIKPLPKMVTVPDKLVTKNGAHKRNISTKDIKESTTHVKSAFQGSQNSKNLEEEIDKLIEVYKKTFPEHIKVYKTGAMISMRDLIKLAVSRGTPLVAVRDRIQESKTGTPWEILSDEWMKEIKRPKTPQEIIEYQKKRLGWSPYEQIMEAKRK